MTKENKNLPSPTDISEEYSGEIWNLFLSQNLEPTSHLGDGTINQAWLSIDLETGSNKILKVGPVVNDQPLRSRIGSGYSDINKFVKAEEITRALRSSGIPAIELLVTGKVEKLDIKFAWCVENVAMGEPLDKVWNELSLLEKGNIVGQIAKYVGEWQKMYRLGKSDFKGDAKHWYEQRVTDLTFDAVNLQIFDSQKLQKIQNSFQKLLNQTSPNNTIGLIHGDLFQPNVFVTKEDNYRVSNIIDWETSTTGHTGYEQLLSAWWFSGEHGGSKEILEKFISVSSTNGIGPGFADRDLDKAILLVDMFWHLNVIVSCVALQKTVDVAKWLRKLDNFILLAGQDIQYANLQN